MNKNGNVLKDNKPKMLEIATLKNKKEVKNN